MPSSPPGKDNLPEQLAKIKKTFTEAKAGINEPQEIEKLKVKFLGRKSALTSILRSLKDLTKEQRALIGREANLLKNEMEESMSELEEKLLQAKLTEFDEKDKIDVTLPGKHLPAGHIHPITQMLWQAEDIFANMGFEIVYPYEVDTDFHNFEALNMPTGHPARDAWDTFWTIDNQIAITHTSSMQHRILSKQNFPIRAVVPGRCFRNEATDARHEHTFYQIEGIYVDKGITFNHLLGTLQTFFSAFFEKEIDVMFSPDFFPFVEPGGMMSLTCVLCDGKGCDVCKRTGWLEILGCGMVHPEVLEMAGIDHHIYTGFAWGFGLERLIMLKYDIKDIRLFHNGKINFVDKF